MTDERKMRNQRIEGLGMVERIVVSEVTVTEHAEFTLAGVWDGKVLGIWRSDNDPLDIVAISD